VDSKKCAFVPSGPQGKWKKESQEQSYAETKLGEESNLVKGASIVGRYRGRRLFGLGAYSFARWEILVGVRKVQLVTSTTP